MRCFPRVKTRDREPSPIFSFFFLRFASSRSSRDCGKKERDGGMSKTGQVESGGGRRRQEVTLGELLLMHAFGYTKPAVVE